MVSAMKPHGRTNPKGVDVALRVTQAIEMRAQSHSWQKIADECGYSSKAAAYNAVKRELAKLPREASEQLVKIELEKLRQLEEANMPKALKGKGQVKYTNTVLNIMARRAKLVGLDDFERRSIELAERQATLEQEQAMLVYEAMNRVFNRLNLTPEQRALLPVVVPEELAKVTAQASAKELELEDLGEDNN